MGTDRLRDLNVNACRMIADEEEISIGTVTFSSFTTHLHFSFRPDTWREKHRVTGARGDTRNGSYSRRNGRKNGSKIDPGNRRGPVPKLEEIRARIEKTE